MNFTFWSVQLFEIFTIWVVECFFAMNRQLVNPTNCQKHLATKRNFVKKIVVNSKVPL